MSYGKETYPLIAEFQSLYILVKIMGLFRVEFSYAGGLVFLAKYWRLS